MNAVMGCGKMGDGCGKMEDGRWEVGDGALLRFLDTPPCGWHSQCRVLDAGCGRLVMARYCGSSNRLPAVGTRSGERWMLEDGRWMLGDGRWKMEDGRWVLDVG